MLRDSEANFPWFAGDVASQRSTEPMIDAEAIHQALVGILKQPDHYGDAARAICGASLAAEAAAISQPCLIFSRPNDPAYAAADALKAALSAAQIIERTTSTQGAAEQITAFLTQINAAQAEVMA